MAKIRARGCYVQTQPNPKEIGLDGASRQKLRARDEKTMGPGEIFIKEGLRRTTPQDGHQSDSAHQKVEQEKCNQQYGRQAEQRLEVRTQSQRLQGALADPQGHCKDLQGFIQGVSPRGADEGSEAWTRVAL